MMCISPEKGTIVPKHVVSGNRCKSSTTTIGCAGTRGNKFRQTKYDINLYFILTVKKIKEK
jgi:hypothetical protein